MAHLGFQNESVERRKNIALTPPKFTYSSSARRE